MQLAARQGGLEHITGIHGPFAFTGTHHGVQLINKQDHLPFLFSQLIQHSFQALFKLATEFGTGNQRTHIQ